MPFKFHRNGRHHIPRQKFRVTNWRDYEAALRSRGSLTIWFTAKAIADWRAQPRATPGGQRHYSDLAIETALTLRAVFGLALRQTEGLVGSIMQLLGIDLPVPDHTTFSRRAGKLRNGIECVGKKPLAITDARKSRRLSGVTNASSATLSSHALTIAAKRKWRLPSKRSIVCVSSVRRSSFASHDHEAKGRMPSPRASMQQGCYRHGCEGP
jgi:hypothetical protein